MLILSASKEYSLFKILEEINVKVLIFGWDSKYKFEGSPRLNLKVCTEPYNVSLSLVIGGRHLSPQPTFQAGTLSIYRWLNWYNDLTASRTGAK